MAVHKIHAIILPSAVFLANKAKPVNTGLPGFVIMPRLMVFITLITMIVATAWLRDCYNFAKRLFCSVCHVTL